MVAPDLPDPDESEEAAPCSDHARPAFEWHASDLDPLPDLNVTRLHDVACCVYSSLTHSAMRSKGSPTPGLTSVRLPWVVVRNAYQSWVLRSLLSRSPARA